MRTKSTFLIYALVVMLTLFTGAQLAGAQGNSGAAHACQDGGWEDLRGTFGETFANQGECVRYAAHGGVLVGSPTVTIHTVIYSRHSSPHVQFTISYVATGFAANTALVDVIYVSPATGREINFVDYSQIFTDSTGSYASGVTDSNGCIDGATSFVTITDSAGNTATGYFTLDCPAA
jgi:hypothetical protein